MNKRKKHLSFKTALFKGAYVHNTLLTMLTGICTVAAGCTSVKNALWLSLIFSGIIILCETLASSLLKGLDRWLRIGLYTLMSSTVLVFPMMFMDAKTVSGLGVYMPLLCVSGIIAVRCEKFAVRTGVYNALVDAVASSVGFFAVAFLTGAVREILSTGKILLFDTSFTAVPAIAMPFAGFLVMGFIAAFHKWSLLNFFPDEFVDTFSIEKADEKPALKDPGLEFALRSKERKAFVFERDEYEAIRPRYSIEEIEIETEGDEE